MKEFYFQICWYYFYLGFILGNWISRIPDIKEQYNLSNTILGVVLIFGAVGAIIALPLASSFNSWMGSAKSSLVGGLWLSGSLPFIGYSVLGLKILIPAVTSIGFGIGIIDVSITAQAVIAEKSFNGNRMGIFLATNALGSFVGVLIGGLMAQLDFSPLFHFCIVGLICTPPTIIAYMFMFPQQEEDAILSLVDDSTPDSNDCSNISTITPFLEASGDSGEESSLTASCPDSNQDGDSKEVLSGDKPRSQDFIRYLAIIGFLSQISVGTLSDWSTLYFRDSLNASHLESAYGFALFSIALAVGNLISDFLCLHYSRYFLVKSAGIISTIGMVIVVGASQFPLAVYVACAGMILTGAGLSIVIPIVSSSSGDIPNVRPSDAIATITSISYIGYLIGPPCFGALSDSLGGLRWALALVGVFTILISLVPGQPPLSRYMKQDRVSISSSSALMWPQKSDEMSAGGLSRTLTSQGYAGF